MTFWKDCVFPDVKDVQFVSDIWDALVPSNIVPCMEKRFSSFARRLDYLGAGHYKYYLLRWLVSSVGRALHRISLNISLSDSVLI